MIKTLTNIIEKHQKPNMQVCEVGCWVGETTRDYIDIIKKNNGTATIVDWFSGNEDIVGIPNHTHAYKPENKDSIYSVFMNNLAGYHDNLRVLRGRSNEVVDQIANDSLDICFIDADHIYEGVKRDIGLYLPKVKSGGVLCGHDCEYIEMANTFTPDELKMHCCRQGVHPGVIQAVWEHFGTNIESPHEAGDSFSVWIYRKP